MQNHNVSFITYFINSTQCPGDYTDVTVSKLREVPDFYNNQVIQTTLTSITKTISMTTNQEVSDIHSKRNKPMADIELESNTEGNGGQVKVLHSIISLTCVKN